MYAMRTHTGGLAFAAIDAALGRFQGHIATKGRWADDGATHLRANRRGYHPCGHGGSRAGRRSARGPRRIKGVTRRTRMGTAELCGDGFAEDDGTCLAQGPDRSV